MMAAEKAVAPYDQVDSYELSSLKFLSLMRMIGQRFGVSIPVPFRSYSQDVQSCTVRDLDSE